MSVSQGIKALADQVDSVTMMTVASPRQIRITTLTVPGKMFDAPMLDDDGCETGERQVLIHPVDWARIKREATRDLPPGRVTGLWGIPVVFDE